MEEALKSLKMGPNILARMTNALWDIFLLTEDEAKMLAGSTLTTKSVRLQTKYLGTRLTKITVHGVPVDISADRLVDYFAQFGQVEEVKVTISTEDFVLQVALMRKSFGEIPNVLLCKDKMMQQHRKEQKCPVKLPMMFGQR